MPAPIAYFAFNRPEHSKQSLAALAANDLAVSTDIFVFCDGPRSDLEKKKTDAVRSICEKATGFKSVTVNAHATNLGCGKAIRTGLEIFFSAHTEGIIVEDDIELAPNALRWFNTCLKEYAEQPTVFSIAAWAPPPTVLQLPKDYPYGAYFLQRFQCWGWASWANRISNVDWEIKDYNKFIKSTPAQLAFAEGGSDLLHTLTGQMEGKIDTWDIQAAYSAFKRGQVSLMPRFSYATNLGTIGEGTHVDLNEERHVTLDIDLRQALNSPMLPEFIFVDKRIHKKFLKLLSHNSNIFLRKTKKIFSCILKTFLVIINFLTTR